MIGNQLALVHRELWEHRAIYVTPMVIAVIVSLMSVTGQVTVSAFDEAVDTAILGITHLGTAERSAFITALTTGISSFFVLAMWVLIVFYALDSLYAERKDRSILFWRSLPCTDAETVLSKLLTALLVIPLVTLVAIILTHLVVLSISSLWLAIRGADAWHLIWQAAPLFSNWLATLVFVLALPLWLSPFVGWFLFVSAYTRRSPLLMAVLPILILPMLERSLIGTMLFTDAFFIRSGSMPLFRGVDFGDLLFFDNDELQAADSAVSMLPLMDLGGFLLSPNLWLGVLVCGLLTFAAIYVRRYRDDS
ncbi:MAG: ABC-2 transporter permease [Woeseia sp.]